MYVHAFTDGNEEIESLQDRITGRFSCEDLKDKDGNILVKKNHMITPRRAERVIKKAVDENGDRSARSRFVRSLPAVAKTVYVRSATAPTWQPEKLYRSERLSVLWLRSLSVSRVLSLPCVRSIPEELPVTISHRVFPCRGAFRGEKAEGTCDHHRVCRKSNYQRYKEET